MKLFLTTIAILYGTASILLVIGQAYAGAYDDLVFLALVLPGYIFIFPPVWIITGIFFIWCVLKTDLKRPAPPDAPKH